METAQLSHILVLGTAVLSILPPQHSILGPFFHRSSLNLWCSKFAIWCRSRKRQIKMWNYERKFYHSSLYRAMPVLNANRRAVNCCAGSPQIKEFTFHSSCVHMYFILHQSSVNATQTQTGLNCFYVASWYAHIWSTLSARGLLIGRTAPNKRNHRLS